MLKKYEHNYSNQSHEIDSWLDILILKYFKILKWIICKMVLHIKKEFIKQFMDINMYILRTSCIARRYSKSAEANAIESTILCL